MDALKKYLYIMDKKTLGIVSYITLIGLIIAFVKNNPKDEYVSFHIRQMIGICIFAFAVNIVAGILGAVLGDLAAILGLVASVLSCAVWILGFLGALKEEKKAVPVLGDLCEKFLKGV